MVDIPLLACVYTYPVDGLPPLVSWIATLKDILFKGFEPWREVMEVKMAVEANDFPTGQPMAYRAVSVVKGMGRISMLLWAVVHTYINLRETMDPEIRDDFMRLGDVATILLNYYDDIIIIKKPTIYKRVVFMDIKAPKNENDRLGGTVVFHNNKKRSTMLHPQYQ